GPSGREAAGGRLRRLRDARELPRAPARLSRGVRLAHGGLGPARGGPRMTPSAAAPALWSIDEIRKEFPALEERVAGKRLVYLDSACTALKSRRVAQAVARDTELGVCGGKRSTHLLAQAVE